MRVKRTEQQVHEERETSQKAARKDTVYRYAGHRSGGHLYQYVEKLA